MSELLLRVKCPMGCENSTITEMVKTIKLPNSNLLLEEGSQKIKVYTCQCCGKTFEINESPAPNGRMIL